LVLAVFLVLILVPYGVLGVTNYLEARNLHTESALSSRRTLVQLSAAALRNRFDHVVDVGKSLATKIVFRQLISQGKWEEAVKLLQTVPDEFSFVDQVALFEPGGVLKALHPYAEGVIGKDFSYRDYYKGVSNNWQPYVSDVFTKAAEPRNNVVVAAIPIKTDNQQVLGLLVLTIEVDTFTQWTKDVDVGPGSFVYYVDKSGNAVGHTVYGDQNEVVSLASEEPVSKVLQGERGVKETYSRTDMENQVIAYEPVKNYGWGAMVQQPSTAAFAIRDARLHSLAIFYSLSTFFLIVLAYITYRFMKLLYLYRENEKVFLESIGDGLVAIDRNWKVTLWNKSASKLTGWSAAEAIGKPFQEIVRFIREKDGQPHSEFIVDAMKTGKVHSMENHTLLIRKDGTKISVGDSAAPVFNQSGKVSGVIIVFRDVSKEVELERSRDEFFSIASHELRTPLTAIRGDSSMMLQYYGEQLKDPALKEMVEDIHAGSVRLIELVSDFLDSSRLEQGRIKFKLSEFDLVPVIKSVLGDVESIAKQKQLDLKLQPTENLPNVVADPDRLKQIIFNLVGNALKFTEHGSVTLELRPETDSVTLTVTDTGSGIPADKQPLLFQKFQQAGRTTMTGDVTQGSGLGLYISRMLAEGMGCSLMLEHSVEGTGSTFALTLPLAGHRPLPIDPATSQSKPVGLG